MLEKISISNKCCSFEISGILSLGEHKRLLSKTLKKSYQPQTFER